MIELKRSRRLISNNDYSAPCVRHFQHLTIVKSKFIKHLDQIESKFYRKEIIIIIKNRTSNQERSIEIEIKICKEEKTKFRRRIVITFLMNEILH